MQHFRLWHKAAVHAADAICLLSRAKPISLNFAATAEFDPFRTLRPAITSNRRASSR